MPAAENVIDYAARLVRATRPAGEEAPEFVRKWVRWGAGPRAGQALLLGGKARALLEGRTVVAFEDVAAVALPVLRHRVLVNFQAEADGIDADEIVRQLLTHVKDMTLEPGALAAIADLELVSKRVVDGTISGLHRSPFHGYSAEFSQYRHYRPGDDLKYIDWKLFARTDRLYTKQFRETTNLLCQIALDSSASMDYAGAAGLTKFQYAPAARRIARAPGVAPGGCGRARHLRRRHPPVPAQPWRTSAPALAPRRAEPHPGRAGRPTAPPRWRGRSIC